MQFGGVRQVGEADGMERGPDHRHYLVSSTLGSSVLLLTVRLDRCDSGGRHYSKVSVCRSIRLVHWV